MSAPRSLRVEMPDKLAFLFEPHRYKVAKGGRGSAKSWSFARALLAMATGKPLRVLCVREVQKSIKDSVHRLISDQIIKMGLDGLFTVLETEIRGPNGGFFLFTGLSSQTAETVKSFEGVDICWVEEGQSISKRSWDILLPTIRKEGSEVWVSYNPDLETDETHQRFAVNTPEDCVLVHCNYSDNPWFSDVLERERVHCLHHYPDDYPNIWEGKCRPAAEGAIYYKEMEAAQEGGRICRVPYDPMLQVHVVVDLGWNDAMALSLVQRNLSEIRVIEYIEDSHKTLDYYSALLKEKRLNWGHLWLPHDGFSGDVKTGKSCADIFTALGWDVPSRNQIAELSVEQGIREARMAFPRTYFDKDKTATLIEHLKRYKRAINKSTGVAGAPLHDDHSHGADNYRYIAINADMMAGVSTRPKEPLWKKAIRRRTSAQAA